MTFTTHRSVPSSPSASLSLNSTSSWRRSKSKDNTSSKYKKKQESATATAPTTPPTDLLLRLPFKYQQPQLLFLLWLPLLLPPPLGLPSQPLPRLSCRPTTSVTRLLGTEQSGRSLKRKQKPHQVLLHLLLLHQLYLLLLPPLPFRRPLLLLLLLRDRPTHALDDRLTSEARRLMSSKQRAQDRMTMRQKRRAQWMSERSHASNLLRGPW